MPSGEQVLGYRLAAGHRIPEAFVRNNLTHDAQADLSTRATGARWLLTTIFTMSKTDPPVRPPLNAFGLTMEVMIYEQTWNDSRPILPMI
jgi:hypothetical protein